MTPVDVAIKATLNAYNLRQILSRVEPHMNTNDWLPGLAGIRLEGDGQHLLAIASDRYTMAIARTKLRSNDGAWAATIPGARLKSLRQWLKAQPSVDNVHISPSGASITFTSPTGELTMHTPDVEFPKWRNMLSTILAEPVQPIPLTAVTSVYLARWQAGGEWLSVSQAAPNRPLVFFGPDFVGLQMPARHDPEVTREQAIGAWESTLGTERGTPAEELPIPEHDTTLADAARDLLRQTLISTNDLFEAPNGDHVALRAHVRAGVHAWTAYRLLAALRKADPDLAVATLRDLNDELEGGEIGEWAWDAATKAGHDPDEWVEAYKAARKRDAERDQAATG